MKSSNLNNLIKNKRVIIVGPSPHLKNKKMGTFIDSFDCIIRINEIGVSDELYSDYGSRTEISFLTLTEDSLKIYKKMKENFNYDSLKIVVHPRDEYNLNPYKEVLKSKNIKHFFNNLDLDVDFYHITNPRFNDRCKSFKCFPTTGGLAIQEILNYDYKYLFVCGFSFFTTKYMYNESRKQYENLISENKTKHNIRKPGHDIYKEVLYLKSLFNKMNKNNIDGDKLFKKVLLSRNLFYFRVKSFFNFYANLDYLKNRIKLILKIRNFI
tara:strand:+ start:367 stop:1170 length:804 start_codon:yes stop_codon:yes gene_type:complete